MTVHNDDHQYGMYRETRVDSRWAEDHEIREKLYRFDVGGPNREYGGVPIGSDGQTVYLDHQDSHTIIFGNTGSMKTRRLGFPTVRTLIDAGESMIITDPKGEIYNRTSGPAKKNGYKIIVLNFREPRRSHRWNIFAEPYRLYHSGDRDKAAELINDFINNFILDKVSEKDPYWDQAAASLALGLTQMIITAASPEEANIKSLLYLRSSGIDGTGKGLIKTVMNRMPRTSFAYTNLNTVFIAPERTFECIVSEFDSHLRLFAAQTSLTNMLSASDFDLGSIGLRKTIVYIIMPDEKTTYHKLITSFIKAAYERLIAVAQDMEKFMLPVRVNFILDEFAQLPRINDFPQMISAARSRNIRMVLFVQSLHQLTSTYSEDAETIISNCNNLMFLTSRELPLLERLTQLAGTTKGGQNLITTAQLQRLSKEKGEVFCLIGRNYPYVSRVADIDEYSFVNSEPEPLPECSREPIKLFDLGRYYSEGRLDSLYVDPDMEGSEPFVPVDPFMNGAPAASRMTPPRPSPRSVPPVPLDANHPLPGVRKDVLDDLLRRISEEEDDDDLEILEDEEEEASAADDSEDGGAPSAASSEEIAGDNKSVERESAATTNTISSVSHERKQAAAPAAPAADPMMAFMMAEVGAPAPMKAADNTNTARIATQENSADANAGAYADNALPERNEPKPPQPAADEPPVVEEINCDTQEEVTDEQITQALEELRRELGALDEAIEEAKAAAEEVALPPELQVSQDGAAEMNFETQEEPAASNEAGDAAESQTSQEPAVANPLLEFELSAESGEPESTDEEEESLTDEPTDRRTLMQRVHDFFGIKPPEDGDDDDGDSDSDADDIEW